jgi:hypothetical protein
MDQIPSQIYLLLTDTSRKQRELNVMNRDSFLESVRNMGSIQKPLPRNEHAIMQAPSILLFLISCEQHTTACPSSQRSDYLYTYQHDVTNQ